MRRTLPALLASILVLSASDTQAQFLIGPVASLGTDTEFGIGGRAAVGLNAEVAQRPLWGQAGFDLYLDACEGFDCTYFEITPSAFVPFAASENLTPFAGAGLNIAHFSYDSDVPGFEGVSDTEIGIALLGGLFFPIGTSLTGQGQAQVNIAGSEQLTLSFALLFGPRPQ